MLEGSFSFVSELKTTNQKEGKKGTSWTLTLAEVPFNAGFVTIVFCCLLVWAIVFIYCCGFITVVYGFDLSLSRVDEQLMW